MSLPGAARALGLGDIRIDSALNEPLSAQIDIVGATRDELIALTAQVANREIFQHYGAERPAFLASATFKVGLDAHGRPVLNVRSAEPFTDPVVNFLVDLRWGNGELIREYSLLLDPAGFAPSGRLAANAAMNEQSAARDTAPAVTVTQNAPPSGGNARAAVAAAAAAAPATNVAAAGTTPAEGVLAGHHRVAPRDTLRAIVRRAGARSESQAQRMMIAIFRANPHAFDNNINLMHQGALLTLPSEPQVNAIAAADARREVRAQMTAWRLDGRPPSARRLAAVPAAPAGAAVGAAPATTMPHETGKPQLDTVAADALKGRVQSLEQALDDMHKQLASESATIQDLKQLAAHAAAPAAPSSASTAPAAAPAKVASVPAPATLPAAGAEPASPAHASVRVEVIRAENHPAPVLAAVATPSNQRMGSAGFLGAAAGLCALLLAGFVYSRRRLLKALAQPKIPAAADPLTITPPHLVAAGPAIEVPKAAPSVSPAPLAAPAIEAPRAAPVAPAAPVAAASAARESVARISSDDTTQDLAIDTELLERSYLDAMAIDTLGIDTANQKSPTHETAVDTETHDTAGLDTVALDASELDSAVDAADLHTAIIDARSIEETRKLEPAVINNASLDYNLLDLDATAEHVHAQHVQMPSGLNDHPVVAERRTNIVDVLKTAIERDPNRRDLRMKLIETYYSAASMNRRAFLEVVKKLSREREFLSAEDWKKVVMMGREIAADDILFADPKDDFANCA